RPRGWRLRLRRRSWLRLEVRDDKTICGEAKYECSGGFGPVPRHWVKSEYTPVRVVEADVDPNVAIRGRNVVPDEKPAVRFGIEGRELRAIAEPVHNQLYAGDQFEVLIEEDEADIRGLARA